MLALAWHSIPEKVANREILIILKMYSMGKTNNILSC